MTKHKAAAAHLTCVQGRPRLCLPVGPEVHDQIQTSTYAHLLQQERSVAAAAAAILKS